MAVGGITSDVSSRATGLAKSSKTNKASSKKVRK